MGSKNKLKRFEENKTFANVIQPSREELLNGAFAYRGRWNELFFKKVSISKEHAFGEVLKLLLTKILPM